MNDVLASLADIADNNRTQSNVINIQQVQQIYLATSYRWMKWGTMTPLRKAVDWAKAVPTSTADVRGVFSQVAQGP